MSPPWLSASPEATFAHGTRLIVVVFAAYLAAAQLLVGVALLVRSARAQRWSDLLSLGLVGRICAATTTGVGALAALNNPALARSEAIDGPAPLLRLLEGPAPPTGEQPVMRLLPADGPGTAEPSQEAVATSMTMEPGPGSTTPTPTTPTPTTWAVRPGESFWSIAEEHLARQHTTVDGQAVSHYWLRLIEANRHRLADPTDPDLIFIGQVLDLPPH